jgi:SAM-dependent methyltransferase
MQSVVGTFLPDNKPNVFGKQYNQEMVAVEQGLSNLFQLKQEQIELINNTIASEIPEKVALDNVHFAQTSVSRHTLEYFNEYDVLLITEKTKKLVKARIGYYIDWRFPGLEIGPGTGTWTRELVASDPLYIIDYNNAALEKTKSRFNLQYQKRLRCYTNMGSGLHTLPQNQFGFVFSWNTFNYFPMDLIMEYTIQIYNVLRPGGVAIVSYNNAERPQCAKRNEDRLMSYITATMLTEHLTSIGFIDIRTYDEDSAVSWIEFSKPGKRISSRGGQTLGKIISASNIR